MPPTQALARRLYIFVYLDVSGSISISGDYRWPLLFIGNQPERMTFPYQGKEQNI
jgi:hypothetical protein